MGARVGNTTEQGSSPESQHIQHHQRNSIRLFTWEISFVSACTHTWLSVKERHFKLWYACCLGGRRQVRLSGIETRLCICQVGTRIVLVWPHGQKVTRSRELLVPPVFLQLFPCLFPSLHTCNLVKKTQIAHILLYYQHRLWIVLSCSVNWHYLFFCLVMLTGVWMFQIRRMCLSSRWHSSYGAQCRAPSSLPALVSSHPIGTLFLSCCCQVALVCPLEDQLLCSAVKTRCCASSCPRRSILDENSYVSDFTNGLHALNPRSEWPRAL